MKDTEKDGPSSSKANCQFDLASGREKISLDYLLQFGEILQNVT